MSQKIYFLEPNVSYYRRVTMPDFFMAAFLIILSLTGLGLIITIPAALIYEFTKTKVEVSDINHKDMAMMTSAAVWKKYREKHGISFWSQYRPNVVIFDQSEDEPQNQNSVNVKSEIEKYKNMFDEGLITQEEFDAKRKQLLKL